MFRPPRLVYALAPSLLFVLLSFSNASAHCFVGARFFPATLAIDDPCVADEMSLPTVAWSKTGDIPPASEVDISVEISKRITETFGVSIGETWSQLQQPGNPTRAGFGDLETTLQYQLLKDDAHELALLAGLIVDWGGHRRNQRRDRHLVQLPDADFLFRPGVRRASQRYARMGAADRRHWADRLSDPDHII